MLSVYNHILEAERRSPPAIITLLGLVVDIGDMVTSIKHPEKRQEIEKERQEEEEREASKQRRIENYTEERNYWQNKILRRHTLSNGETVNGDIICPRSTVGQDGIDLIISIDSNKGTFSWYSIE